MYPLSILKLFTCTKQNFVTRTNFKLNNNNNELILILKKIDYARITGKDENEPICFPQTGHLLPTFKTHPNVPEAFEDKYFSKKEKENLLELKDILNRL